MNYLIMETHMSYCVVLDSAGRFLKAVNFGYEEGQTIDRIVLLERDAPAAFPVKKVMAAAGALAACLVVALGVNFYNAVYTVYGNVYMTINPQVELQLNSKGEVLHIIAQNSDGERIVQGVSAERRAMEEVSEELIANAIDAEMLADGGFVMLGIDSPEHDEWLLDTAGKLRETLEPFLAERVDARLYVYDYNEEQPDPEQSQPEQPAPERPKEPVKPVIVPERPTPAPVPADDDDDFSPPEPTDDDDDLPVSEPADDDDGDDGSDDADDIDDIGDDN